MKFILIFCFLFSAVQELAAMPLVTPVARDNHPFNYDGCTMFIEGPPSEPNKWADCCFEHDLFYWAGGVKKQRLAADRGLRQCFRDKGYPRLAELIYIAVRTGRISPLPFRGQQWGNAWSPYRNYRCLNSVDIQSIELRLADYEFDGALKDKLLRSLHSRCATH